jgi:hypothetical protein
MNILAPPCQLIAKRFGISIAGGFTGSSRSHRMQIMLGEDSMPTFEPTFLIQINARVGLVGQARKPPGWPKPRFAASHLR